jgi:Uma2 family endonuclease
MAMGVPPISLAPMTVEEFFAFTDKRPDDEKWELIDGEPVLNPTPSYLHQRIVGSLLFLLTRLERAQPRPWTALPGIGVRVSDTKLPVPDVLIRPKYPPKHNPMSRDCDDMIVAFEVLSPSTKTRDLLWKRVAYTALSSLTHYVVIAQDAVDVVVFAREAGFAECRIRSRDDSIELLSLGISLPLTDIYQDAGLH